MGWPGLDGSVGGHRTVRRWRPARRRNDLCGHHGHGRRPDRSGARGRRAALVRNYLGSRGGCRSVHRVDFGCAARDGSPHARAPVVAAQQRPDIDDRPGERRADSLSRWLVHRRECGRHIRARPGGGIALDAGTPLLHVRLDRGGQRFPAGIRETTGISGARGRELAERALPGASSRRVRHTRRAIPPLPPRPAPDCSPAMGPPRAGTAWRQPGRAIPDPDARSVAIAGDWNAWQPVRLRPLGDDVWEGTLVLRRGLYHFNLQVDGSDWVVPNGVATVPDGLGGMVAVLLVP